MSSEQSGIKLAEWPKISELVEQIKSGKKTASQNVAEALGRLKATEDYDHSITLLEDYALNQAKLVDEKVASGANVGPLAGVPYVLKDNFLILAGKTTAASNILKNFEAPYQATVVARLEAAGAICVAKANLDAFAHGSSTENSDFFVTKNPHDKTRVPGGSSGGSAAAVALNCVPFALGTDTGGSVRLPASYCGIIGYKPTYGLVSRNGVIAMASSTDCIGTFTKNPDDLGAVMDVIAGQDENDSTTIDRENSYLPGKNDLKGLKIGLIKEYMNDGLSDEVRQHVDAAIKALKARGVEIVEVSLPSLPLALAVYYIVVPAELSSNLARYDGQRFGYSDLSASNLENSYSLSRSEGFGAEAKRRIMIGTYVLSSGYYDAYYKKAQTVRTKLINEFNDALKAVDYLIGPVAPDTAFKIGENVSDPLKMYLTDIMTVSANLVGVPSISLPITVANGSLPIGLQVIAAQKQDANLLSFAKSLEGVI